MSQDIVDSFFNIRVLDTNVSGEVVALGPSRTRFTVTIAPES
jgi:hypothetical protein